MKQSCTVKGVIGTNQIRDKNIIVILSNTTVAHFEVLLAVSLSETLFSFFFLFNTRRKGSEKQRQIILHR